MTHTQSAIEHEKGLFRLSTAHTSYWFRVTAFGHLEHLHYGGLLPPDQEPEPLALKRSSEIGTAVAYDASDKNYCLDNLCLEWSGIGRGDFRDSPAEIKMPDGSFSADFQYKAHSIFEGTVSMQGLPGAVCATPLDNGGGDSAAPAHGPGDNASPGARSVAPAGDDGGDSAAPAHKPGDGAPLASAVSAGTGGRGCSTLQVDLADASNKAELTLYYTVFPETDVITRRAVLTNNGERPLVIRKLMSMMLDMPNRDFQLITFDGGWIKEGIRHSRPLAPGIYINSSVTGASSNRHNPGFLLAEPSASENRGRVYGFNLIYSGNHFGAVELSNHDIVRVEQGINPHCFEWTLEPGAFFETPEAVLCCSDGGFGGLSECLHDFVNRHIVRGDWQGRERPVLYNNWEATFFKFRRGKLLRLARRAKALGIELFVLDDGWFEGRSDDDAGLGDYAVDRRKLPGGIGAFSRKIRRMGMRFGLWFEPEMVNEDSALFRAHPEYIVRTPGKRPAKGRNQWVLDLCRAEVRDYIVDNVSRILDEAAVDYVKWDFNRHLSDAFSKTLENQGEFYHRYILGLYDVLRRIFAPRPQILFESCASGGNRFDLGMLCFSPQIWVSDDTDPVERLKIQGGLSAMYPLSVMGAHVSDAPHQQTLRDTPLTTRFNVAVFGCLGYEMDLRFLSRMERQEIKEQIAFYKAHRKTFQYGRFFRQELTADRNGGLWHCIARDGSEAVSGFFQTLALASPGPDRLSVPGLETGTSYLMQTRPQSLFIKRFGGLVKHILPVNLNPDGFILRMANRVYRMTDCVETYAAYGATLAEGILLNNQFMGGHYNERIRILGDFGSNLYVTTRIAARMKKQGKGEVDSDSIR